MSDQEWTKVVIDAPLVNVLIHDFPDTSLYVLSIEFVGPNWASSNENALASVLINSPTTYKTRLDAFNTAVFLANLLGLKLISEDHFTMVVHGENSFEQVPTPISELFTESGMELPDPGQTVQ